MFQDILQKIAHHVDGVRGCILLDPDSMPIAEVYPGESDEAAINALGIELTNMVNSLVRRQVLDEVGAVQEFSLTTSRLVTLCRSVGQNHRYVLLVALGPEADATRGMTMLRLMSPWIERLL